MEHVMDVRPKVRQSSLFIPTENGLFVKGEKTGFHIKGKSVAHWITALWPYMTGEYTLSQLCARLEPAQREHVTRLISTLLHKGVLKNALPEAPGILPEEVYRQFQSQIEYLDHFVDYPREHFKKFRESSLLLYGAGESLTSLALSLVRNGLRTLTLALPAAPADLQAGIAAVRQGGSEVSLSLLPAASVEAAGSFAEYDVLVYCADNGSLKDIFALNQRCVREGRTFLAATPFAGQVMLGPLVRPGQGSCWLCALLRLSANSDARTSAASWQSIVLGSDIVAVEEGPFLPVARRIGYGLGFELFKALSGCLTPETEQGVIIQNLQHLESSLHPLVRHPSCPVCSRQDPLLAVHQLEEVVERRRDCEQTDPEIYEQHQCLLDQRLGLFRRFADEEVEQLPLKRARLLGGAAGDGAGEVAAFSLHTTLSARVQALKKAIGTYTSSISDMRALIQASQAEMEEQGRIAVLPQGLALWAGALSPGPGRRCAWLPAFSLAQHALVYVPAAAVYSRSSLNSQGIFERTAAGVAVETAFERVLIRGMLSALTYENLCEWVHGRARVASIDLNSLDDSDPDLRFLLQSARRFARPFALKEVTSYVPLALVIAHSTDGVGPRVVTTALELSAPGTVKAALQQIVGEMQILESGDQLSGASGEDVIARILASSDLPCSDQQVAGLHRPEATLAQIQRDLEQAGRDLLFAHTTSADIWDTGALIAGRVLLTRPAPQAE